MEPHYRTQATFHHNFLWKKCTVYSIRYGTYLEHSQLHWFIKFTSDIRILTFQTGFQSTGFSPRTFLWAASFTSFGKHSLAVLFWVDTQFVGLVNMSNIGFHNFPKVSCRMSFNQNTRNLPYFKKLVNTGFGIRTENVIIWFAAFPYKTFLGHLTLIYHLYFNSPVAPTTFNCHLIIAASRPILCVYKPWCNSE